MKQLGNHLDKRRECLAYYVEIDMTSDRWRVKVLTRDWRELGIYHSINDGSPRTQPSCNLLNAMTFPIRRSNLDRDGKEILRRDDKITFQLYNDLEVSTAKYGERPALLTNWFVDSGFRFVY